MLVHIGYHKTATTWLQRRVFDPGRLGFFPVSENGDDSMAFGWEFLCGPGERPDWGGRLASPFDFDAGAVRAKFDRLVAGRDGLPVISHEDLCGHMLIGGMTSREIAERLHAVFPEARILVTIREQTGLIHSSYGHFLRAGGICGLRRYLTTFNEYQTPMFDPEHLRYHRLTAFYQGLFGAERVKVMAYEAFAADPRAFLAELQAFVGLSGPLDGIDFAARENAESRSFDMVNRLFPLAGLLASPNNLNARAAFGSTRWKGRAARALSLAIPERLARAYLARQKARIGEILGPFYAESNARLAALTGLDLRALGYDVAG